jgi:hypothetical protein
MKTNWLFLLASLWNLGSNTNSLAYSTGSARISGCDLQTSREPFIAGPSIDEKQPPNTNMAKSKMAAVVKAAKAISATSKPAAAVKPQKKDYAYRSTWKHKLSRAKNLAKRGGMTKPEMMAKHGRFPKKNEWWGPEENEKEWLVKWTKENPKY